MWNSFSLTVVVALMGLDIELGRWLALTNETLVAVMWAEAFSHVFLPLWAEECAQVAL